MRVGQLLVALTVALLCVSSGPVAATTIFLREFTCPVDGEKFKQAIIGSASASGRDLDLRPIGRVPFPFPLPKCPTSGFVIFRTNFTPHQLDILRAYVASHEYRALRNHNSTHYLAYKLRVALGTPEADLRLDLLLATWEPANRRTYARVAREALGVFEAALADPANTGAIRIRDQVLAGELERRLGMFARAAKRFRGLAVREEIMAVEGLAEVVLLQLDLIRRGDARRHECPNEGKGCRWLTRRHEPATPNEPGAGERRLAELPNAMRVSKTLPWRRS